MILNAACLTQPPMLQFIMMPPHVCFLPPEIIISFFLHGSISSLISMSMFRADISASKQSYWFVQQLWASSFLFSFGWHQMWTSHHFILLIHRKRRHVSSAVIRRRHHRGARSVDLLFFFWLSAIADYGWMLDKSPVLSKVTGHSIVFIRRCPGESHHLAVTPLEPLTLLTHSSASYTVPSLCALKGDIPLAGFITLILAQQPSEWPVRHHCSYSPAVEDHITRVFFRLVSGLNIFFLWMDSSKFYLYWVQTGFSDFLVTGMIYAKMSSSSWLRLWKAAVSKGEGAQSESFI